MKLVAGATLLVTDVPSVKHILVGVKFALTDQRVFFSLLLITTLIEMPSAFLRKITELTESSRISRFNIKVAVFARDHRR